MLTNENAWPPSTSTARTLVLYWKHNMSAAKVTNMYYPVDA